MVLVISVPEVVPFFITLMIFKICRMNIIWKQGLLMARQKFRGQISFLSFCFAFISPLFALVLLCMELLLPSFIQVNQSLVVEDKQDEVQCIGGNADDTDVLQDEVEDVAEVQRPHH